MSPRTLFRGLAVAEALTWALLLAGMFLKYVTRTTEVGVQVFGMVHGVVFIAYCLVALIVGVDRRWSAGRLLLALVSAVPPFMTLWFERHAERRGLLAPAWSHERDTAPRRAVTWLVSHARVAVPLGVLAVAGLTGVALLAGPPAG